jgi:hypothetical protein
MDFRFRIFLLIIFFGFIKAEAQTVGFYSGTFFSGWSPDLGRNYMFGPEMGVFANGFLKGKFNPGIDIQYTQHAQLIKNRGVEIKRYPYYTPSEKYITSDLQTFNAITDIKATFELTTPQDDTLVLAIGLQGGAADLQDKMQFSNPELTDFDLANWTPSYGVYGSIRRNYILGSPLQLSFTFHVQGYSLPQTGYLKAPITKAFAGGNSLTVGYAKLGLAYKFR